MKTRTSYIVGEPANELAIERVSDYKVRIGIIGGGCVDLDANAWQELLELRYTIDIVESGKVKGADCSCAWNAGEAEQHSKYCWKAPKDAKPVTLAQADAADKAAVTAQLSPCDCGARAAGTPHTTWCTSMKEGSYVPF